jgi:hypothetical protein
MVSGLEGCFVFVVSDAIGTDGGAYVYMPVLDS